MTVEEIKKRIMEFENMMGDFHNAYSAYGGHYRRTLTIISELFNAFGKNKERKIYEQLLEDVKLVYNQLPYNEYMELRYRIISAYEA